MLGWTNLRGTLLNLTGAGSRFRWPPGVGDDDLLAAAFQDRRYGGGPGLPVSRLHRDFCTNELRGQRGSIAEVDGAPVPVVQTVGTPARERIGGSLDGQDRAGIIQGEGKGDTRTEARRRSRSVRFTSLPAGINTDDSDPLRATSRRATLHAYSWPQVTPFSGGSLSSSRIFLYRHYGIRVIGGKPMKTKEFKESVAGTPPRFFLVHPPLCVCGTKYAVICNMKTPRFNLHVRPF